MYELLSVNNAERIKEILLTNQLEDDIVISKNNLNISLEIDRVSENQIEENWGNEEFLLENENTNKPLCINNKDYWISIKVGWWRDSYRIPNSHITLGTNYSGFGAGHKFFSQLELSQALEDKYSLYIVKNISNLSGEGAISRLNSGLREKSKKAERRSELVKRLNYEVIKFQGHEWVVVNKISKKEINEITKAGKIFSDFLQCFLNYSLTIEEIIKEVK